MLYLSSCGLGEPTTTSGLPQFVERPEHQANLPSLLPAAPKRRNPKSLSRNCTPRQRRGVPNFLDYEICKQQLLPV
jgi:hypothetical protein